MRKKILVITIILMLLLVSTTLCFESEKNPKKPPKGPWLDLTKFNDLMDRGFQATYKDEPGSSLIKSIGNSTGSLYILVGTDEPITEDEAAAILYFVKSGGNLIVGADNTNVNNLSMKFGVKYSEHKILDKGYDYNYSFIPVDVNDGPNQYSIIVHSPRGLEITANDYIITGISNEYPETVYSVLDLNDNNKMDAEDQPGPIPIVVEVYLGKGKAVFISDAGLFTDNLWKLTSISDKPGFLGHVYENEDYITNLVFGMYKGDTLIYDRSKQTANFSNFHPYPTGN